MNATRWGSRFLLLLASASLFLPYWSLADSRGDWLEATGWQMLLHASTPHLSTIGFASNLPTCGTAYSWFGPRGPCIVSGPGFLTPGVLLAVCLGLGTVAFICAWSRLSLTLWLGRATLVLSVAVWAGDLARVYLLPSPPLPRVALGVGFVALGALLIGALTID